MSSFIAAQPVSLVIEKPVDTYKFALAIVYTDAATADYAHRLKELLNVTELIDAHTLQTDTPQTKNDISKHLLAGYSAVLFLEHPREFTCAWRLYDATQVQMLVGKTTRSSSDTVTLRLVADAVMNQLFNHESFFLTQILFVKRIPSMRHTTRTALCTVDPATGTQQTLLTSNRILVAPQWMPMDNADTLWMSFSEFTPSNVRLLGANTQGNVWSILDSAGTFVGAVQQGRNSFVYVRSGALWLYEFNKQHKKGMHTRLTDGRSTCACPSLVADDIIYSCDGGIYRYISGEKRSVKLPVTGYCLSPHAHAGSDRIVFSRSVKGALQLHTVRIDGSDVRQITHNAGDKSDACFSPCGNYVVYVKRDRQREQIAVFNLLVGTEKMLTGPDEICSYPCWSPACKGLVW